ncbi:MAG: DUF349 domain-containing protein [Flavobacteriales bacterium]|nr:DUF349 domain-containing protein [Flavobacteriales bacterium]
MEELLQQADVEQAAEAVDGVKEAYEALIAAAQQQAASEAPVPAEAEAPTTGEGEAAPTGQAAPPAEVQPQPIENAPLQDEEDKRFKQLVDAFHTKVNDIRRQRQKEEADNLAAKKAIMDELRGLISGEENIGNAFQRFNELQEKWRTIGNVPATAYRELQSDFSHLRDEFFYHIRIYKELRDHDLKKNTAMKRALIADMEAVQRVDSVKEAEALVREYQEKWHQIGPVVKEEWEAVRDGFWNATRVVYDRINEYYKARRAEHEANLAAKQALVDKVNEVVKLAENIAGKEWKLLTDQVMEAQTAWKSIGFATKKDNERIWKEFRTACNAFFDRKNEHFTALKDQFKAAREKKQHLVEQALGLKGSTEWKSTAERLKQLQAEWKQAGSAGPRDENRLWSKFREACDGFFQARKAFFDKLDAEQADGLKAKNELIAEIEAFQLSGERARDLDALKAFSQRWLTSGRVSPKNYDLLSERYRKALDKQYDKLRLEGDERRRMQFHERVENLKSAPDGKDRIEREGRFVKRKIEELEMEVKQMERNMGMFNFKSASGEAMRKDMEKKIDRARVEIGRLRDQLRELNRQARGEAAPKPASAAAPEAPATAPGSAEEAPPSADVAPSTEASA